MVEPSEEPPEVVAIAAVGLNGVIGAEGDIPWRIPADWARFKATTLGHVLVMGRKTFDSIGRPLPGRQTVVLTRDRQWRRAGVLVAHDVDEAIDLAETLHPGLGVYVAGGGEVYRAAWSRTTRLEITRVEQSPSGEATFPEVDEREWQLDDWEQHDGFAFTGYHRRSGDTRTGFGSRTRPRGRPDR